MNKIINVLHKNKIPNVKGIVKRNYTLSNNTWFRVGGKAEIFFIPKDIEDLVTLLKNLNKNIPIKVLGAGSNTLVRDGGVSGVTIKLDKSFSKLTYLDNQKIYVEAGLNCTKLARETAKNNLGGLEFLSGIPGTVGGAIKMNAGAYGSETSNFLDEITVVNREGKVKSYFKKDLKMSYRKSSLKKNEIVVSAIFKCKKENKISITKKIKGFNEKRIKTQPVKFKTSGSTFKNPLKCKAWKLIKDSGCENLSKGGAIVSSLHSNFIINQGIAKAIDVEDLGKEIIEKVFTKFGIKLDWEVKIIGSKNKFRKYFND